MWSALGVERVGAPSVRSIAKRTPKHTALWRGRIERQSSISPTWSWEIIGDDHVRHMHGCNQAGCAGKAVWKCDGCRRSLCANHQTIANHDCTTCHYCDAPANGVCSGCEQYSCKMSGCSAHRRRCAALQTALLAGSTSRSPVIAKMYTCSACLERGTHTPCVVWMFPAIGNGWIITTNNTERIRCHKCLGHTCL